MDFRPLSDCIPFMCFPLVASNSLGKIEKLVSYSVFIPLILYVILIPTDLVELTENGPKGWISGRALATYLLIVLSLSLAQWRYATTKGDKNRGIFVSMLALGIIGFTLSRMAIATALLLLGMARINPLRIWRKPALCAFDSRLMYRAIIRSSFFAESVLLSIPFKCL